MMSFLALDNKMINLTLDTSCFDKKSAKHIEELKNLEKMGIIKIWHELYSEIETDRWNSMDKDKIKDLFHTHSNVKLDSSFIPSHLEEPQEVLNYLEQKQGYKLEDLHNVHVKIDMILHPEGFHGKKSINKYIDGKLLAKHIVRKRDIFVTKDYGFIKNGKKEKLEKEFPNIKIRILDDDFVKELKDSLN